MEYIIKHDLSPELAKKAADKAAECYTKEWEKYDAKSTWVGDDKAEIAFRVKGVNVVATVEMQPGQAVIEMQEVPLLLRPFENMALDVVRRTMENWMVRAKNGELD